MKKLLIVFLGMMLSLITVAQSEVDYPIPTKTNKVNTKFGQDLPDPYSWMRKKDSNAVINHLYNENAYADNIMESSKLLRLMLYEEMKSRMNMVETDLPTPLDQYFYYTRYDKGDNFPKYLRKKDSLSAKEELVFDFNSLVKDFMFFIPTLVSVSPNHNWLCYGVDNTGNRDNMLFFKKIGPDSTLSIYIPRATSMVWCSDNEHIYYSISDSLTKRVNQIFLYKVGEPLNTKKLVFQEDAKEYQIEIGRAKSGDNIFITSSKADTSEVYVLDAKIPTVDLKKIIDRKEGNTASIYNLVSGEYFILSNKDNNNLAVYTMNEISSSDKWKMLIAPKVDTMIQGITVTQKYLLVTFLADAQNFVQLYYKDGRFIKTIKIDNELKSDGVANPYKSEENRVRFYHSTFLRPSVTYDYWIDSNRFVKIDMDTLRFKYNPADYVVERIYVKARDGESIPVSVMYKKGLDLTIPHPMYLTAYGSYGSTGTPYFSKARLPYLNRDFIYVDAQIRGSSAKGRRWYDDGKMFKKKNTFNDFIDVALYFQEIKWTTPALTAIQGGSAGGLLMGAVINDRPDIFGCVVADVPFVDVMNTMLDEKIPLTTFEYHEWGNPNIKEQFEYMRTYSPYDNVKAQNYPPMLVTSGFNDSQVAYWEPAKWVARLRETKTDTNKIIFKTNMKSGHGGASGRYEILKDAAYGMAFILKSLNIKEDYARVNGRVYDENGSPFMFCNVMVVGTTNGTVTNDEGTFSLDIKTGQALKLEFSSMGFEKKTISIDPDKFSGLIEVKMKSSNLLLNEVVISSKAKDPAYAIIKSAIKAKKGREKLLESYQNEIYIKNTTRLNKIPKKLPKFLSKAELPDSNDIGLMSLSESVAKFYFKKPDKCKEEMLASKQSGTQNGFSWNRASDVMFDFYDNYIELTYYSARPFLSPIASTALLSYDYKKVGTFKENNRTVNKIKVMPKRKGDPLFQGYVNIVDSTWDIHSVELFLTQDAQIEFVDTLWMSQEYVMVDNTIRMPLKVVLKSYIQIFGFSATDLSVGSFSSYKINEKYPKKFFTNELFKIQDNANKKDSIYWTENRGALLTDEESKYYYKADSIRKVHESPAYIDSVMRKYNKTSISKILLSGFSYSKRRGTQNKSYSLNSVLGMMQFNPVQGLNPNLRFSYFDYDRTDWTGKSFSGNINYGISDKVWNGGLSFYNFSNRKNSANYSFRIQKSVSQYNESNPVPSIFETYLSPFTKINYARLLRQESVGGSYSKELINGLYGTVDMTWAQKKMAENNTQFSFLNKNKLYAEQLPLNDFISNTGFAQYQRIRTKIGFMYQHKQQYENLPNMKIIHASPYPPIYLSYQKIIGLNRSFSSDLLELGTGKDFDLKLFGDFKIDFNCGFFMYQSKLPFPEYYHFEGNGILFLRGGESGFNFNSARSRNLQFETLDYYKFSTNKNFMQLHAMHNFKGWLLGKFPLVRTLKLHEIVGFNTLYTGNKSYSEVYAGLGNIAKVFRIDVAATYENGKTVKPVLRIGVYIR
ncbi:MAG: DUF5686 family protein [Bacteroidota bacterium]